MKPVNLKTKIFLDSGDSAETRKILGILGFLNGQTTNPTLISKNSEVAKRLEKGEKFSAEEIYSFYRNTIHEISDLIPDGSISIEVYADSNTTAKEMLQQGREMFNWIPNAHIKLPVTKEGLAAAEQVVKEGVRINMTLCFSQEQAAAVYAATRGAKKGQVFISPFVGRLDDKGENGMDLIRNIIRMYKEGDGYVEVLVASVRSLDHLLCGIQFGSDIITVPAKVLGEWVEKGLPLPNENFVYEPGPLGPIPYKEIDLSKNWREYEILHELTDKGIERFSEDWNKLIASN